MKKIMIVDDEEISLMMTTHILSSEYMTVCASSGEEAVKLYEIEKPDLVLSDLRMPNMDGYTLQTELQKRAGEQVPFMFMTADKDEETESKGFENGAMDFIRKPFRADVLVKRVANILQTIEKIKGLKIAAETDPMTGCLNKSSSQEEITKLCQRTQGVLMIVDLDSFKLVNDIHGHGMGDRILIRFAEILRSSVRTSDVVGRMGGDEFIMYCQNIKDEEVLESKTRFINEHIVESAKEFMGEDMNIPLGASIGCVFVPDEGEDFKQLHQKADQALYQVKKNGKHGFAVFKSEMVKSQQSMGSGSGVAQIVQLLNERNKIPGAFMLSPENFKTLYQFMSRMVENYHRRIWILVFTVEKGIDTSVEKFGKVVQSSMRKSDVLTQHGKNQFVVLLQNAQEHNIFQIIGRIMKKWASEQPEDPAMILVEHDYIK